MITAMLATKKNLLTSLLLLLFLVQSCGDGDTGFTTVYLIRHAEKDLTDTTDNPPLTDAGRQRAERLVEVIGETPIEGIYSTEFDRNMNTVQPLANKKNIQIQTYPWHEWQDMIDEIKKAPGKNFVVCGHGDNLIPMIGYMGGTSPLDSLGKHEYDKIFKVSIRPDTTSVEVITY
jgi:2,3-bisphosphoglycerate-dependent phosphoglycerate mutase